MEDCAPNLSYLYINKERNVKKRGCKLKEKKLIENNIKRENLPKKGGSYEREN